MVIQALVMQPTRDTQWLYMATKKGIKKREPYCIKKRGNYTRVSIPREVVSELEIKDGEKPVWRTEKYKRDEKTLKIKIIRGESLFDGE